MERRVEDEKQADADSASFCHQLVSEVQQECLKNLYVSIVGCKVVDENVLEYTIEDRVWVRDPNTRKDVPTRRKREYEVKYNLNSYEAWCVYKLMESSGIICRHIIAVFEKNDVEEVHDMFILRRWRKDVQRKHTMVKVAYHDPSKTDEVKRYDRMMVRFEPICLTASDCEEDMDIVLDCMHTIESRLNERRNKGRQSEGGDNLIRTPSSVGNVRGNVALTSPALNGGTIVVSPGDKESCAKSAEASNIKVPPSKAKPHRTTDRRYPSLVEKVAKKTRKTKKTKSNAPTNGKQVLIISTDEINTNNCLYLLI
ncbi:Protein FAR1-RELATED SEQUENCE 6 [Bienertia sinuspersici]